MEINIIKKMLLAGSKSILENKQTLNDMNVFPIPDGDTGTNMDKTMSGIVKVLIEIGDRDLKPADFDELYKSALMNSQGNSGVILSQWLKGFLKALRDETELDPGNLVVIPRPRCRQVCKVENPCPAQSSTCQVHTRSHHR